MKNTLTRARILEQALELVECEGLDRLSMRKLADRLGVAPMSLYTHISGKEALLDGIVEEMLAEVVLPPVDTSDPLGRVRDVAHALRQAAHKRPEVFRIIAVMRPTPGLISMLDSEVANLQEMGFSGERAAEALRLSLGFVFGYLRLETGGFFRELALTSDEQATRFPDFDEISPHLRDWDADGEFDAGLEAFLSGLGASSDDPSRTGKP